MTSPHKEESQRKTAEENFAESLSVLLVNFSDRQFEILRLIDHIERSKLEIDDRARATKELIESRLNEDLDEEGLEKLYRHLTETQESSEEDVEDKEANLKVFEEILSSLPEGHVHTYLENIVRAYRRPPSGEFLFPSLLVTLVGEVEIIINRLARACYTLNPDLIKDGEQKIEWREIAHFKTVAEVQEMLVDRRIDQLLRGSLTDWISYFEKKVGIPSITAVQRRGPLEAVQRRHCIVHNGGHASALYIEKTSGIKPRPKTEEGDYLPVDPEYLRSTADELYLVIYSLIWSLGNKFCKEDNARQKFMRSVINGSYYLLQDQRYDLLKLLKSYLPFAQMEAKDALILKTNIWLAHKLDDDFEAVRHEVERLDVKARSRLFLLTKHALLDETDAASDLAEKMIRDDELKREHLLTWPLLRDVHHKRGEENAPRGQQALESEEILTLSSGANDREEDPMSTTDL